MRTLERIDVAALRRILKELNADGWLVYDFHGVNPVAQRLIGYRGMVTRRFFAFFPASGRPVFLVHAIDAIGVGELPGDVMYYTTWQELAELLEKTVAGHQLAMEVSPQNVVPYLDRVPAGLIEELNRLGVTIVSSERLVTQFAACWTPEELDIHRAVAETLSNIANETLERVITQSGAATEFQVQCRVQEAFAAAGLETEDPPIVAFGANAADPHHESNSERVLQPDEIVLLDLWARKPGFGWADQTWMAFSGKTPPADVQAVWEATRDARDAAVDRLRAAVDGGQPVTGAQLDDAARQILVERGYGEAFLHRTGHSIDADLHGSGPHLDNFETHDTRMLLPGVVFSVEPGVYLKGKFGVRSEINVILQSDGPEVTPQRPQTELIHQR